MNTTETPTKSEETLSYDPPPVMIRDERLLEHLAEYDGMLLHTRPPRPKPLAQRMVIALITLIQHVHKCKGFKMPKIHMEIEGREISQEDLQALLPEGATITGHDTGNGNTSVEIESKDPLAGIISAAIKFEPEVVKTDEGESGAEGEQPTTDGAGEQPGSTDAPAASDASPGGGEAIAVVDDPAAAEVENTDATPDLDAPAADATPTPG